MATSGAKHEVQVVGESRQLRQEEWHRSQAAVAALKWYPSGALAQVSEFVAASNASSWLGAHLLQFWLLAHSRQGGLQGRHSRPWTK